MNLGKFFQYSFPNRTSTLYLFCHNSAFVVMTVHLLQVLQNNDRLQQVEDYALLLTIGANQGFLR